MIAVHVQPHPLLALAALHADFATAPGGLSTPAWLAALLEAPAVDAERAGQAEPGAPAPVPLAPDPGVRPAIRALLRHGGYKPSGRSKPASEYLQGAAAAGALGAINAAVDTCNAVSLHSGLPISVVDVARLRGPLRVGLAEPGARYVFNASGQEIDLGGLLCLFDAEGPCASPVKDSQRTKTSPQTTGVLWLIWGSREVAGRTAAAEAWTRELLTRLGARVTAVELASSPPEG
jgi:DNA/RNA-binding domain of Phe-tRNA-synthetase-like protein